MRKRILRCFAKRINARSLDHGASKERRRSWIDLFREETQYTFSDSFIFKNPMLRDFLEETHLS